MNPRLRRTLRVIVKLLLILLTALLLYLLYLILSYNRIDDEVPLYRSGKATSISLQANKQYTAATWNLGFGAYLPSFTFFMDNAYMEDGTYVEGLSAKAFSKDSVVYSTKGIISVLQSLQCDFMLLQEVDVKASRSYGVNMNDLIRQAFKGYESVFAINYHSPYYLYPFNDPIGRIQSSGLLTLSSVESSWATRYSYPVDDGFSKFLDLDRCFSSVSYPVDNGRTLVLINNHMSAYDENGTIRAQQLKKLFSYIREEYSKGSYVILGGDFNHVLGSSDNIFIIPSQQQRASWIEVLGEDEIPEGFTLVLPSNMDQTGTCRSASIAWEEGVDWSGTIDGFIVSNNVQAQAINIDTGYAYSDHQPSRLAFTLL